MLDRMKEPDSIINREPPSDVEHIGETGIGEEVIVDYVDRVSDDYVNGDYMDDGNISDFS